MAASPESRAHCAVGLPLRLEAEQNHEQGDDRDGDGQDDERGPVGPAHQARRTTGASAGEHGGGEVAGEVDVEGVDALGGRRRQLAGALAGQPRRAEAMARASSCRRRVEVTWAEVRWAASSPSHASTARPAKAPPRPTRSGDGLAQATRARPGRSLDDAAEQDGLDHHDRRSIRRRRPPRPPGSAG